VLTSFDDYPIHQTPQPIALTGTSDINFYDRYFFNGYTKDAGVYFAAAMGLYPNRHVADAAFSVVRNGQQVNVHASRRAPSDRMDALTVGPIKVEVLQPLRQLRLLVDAPEHGVRADLTITARSAPLQEPPFLRRSGQRIMMDITRLTQFGSWTGWIEVDGERTEIDAAQSWGSRDRSWGVRPVGERGPSGAPTEMPQYYWLWAPVNFDDFCTHFDVNETSSGERWHEEALVVPDDGAVEHMVASPYRISWTPGTRRATNFSVDMLGPDGATTVVDLEPLVDFQMMGIGYTHPEWSHGVWKGELAVGGDRWALPVDDPTAPQHLHIQALCRATCTRADGTVAHGLGILEQFVIGPHEPTGLTGLFDGYTSPTNS